MLLAATELSVLDQLYIVSFSIFYGVMLHTLKGLRAFDTSSAFMGKKQPLTRFAMSVVFLNLLPFLEFSVIILYGLQNLELNIFSILVVFGLSIGIFGFDKVFHALLIREREKLYTTEELETVIDFSSAMARKFSSHHMQFLVPGLLYIFIPIGVLMLVLNPYIGDAILAGIAITSLFLWNHWKESQPRVMEKIEKPESKSQQSA